MHIFGVVKTSDGHVISGTHLIGANAYLSFDDGLGEHSAQIGSDGTFDFGFLSPGTGTITLPFYADPTGEFPGAFIVRKQVVVTGEGTELFVTLTTPAIHVLTVHAQNYDGSSIPNAIVSQTVSNYSDQTDGTSLMNTNSQSSLKTDSNGDVSFAVFDNAYGYSFRVVDAVDNNRFVRVTTPPITGNARAIATLPKKL